MSVKQSEVAIVVREMDPSEVEATRALFRQLNLIERYMFTQFFNGIQNEVTQKTGGTLVAVLGTAVVGCVSVHIKEIKRKKCGFIDALVADKGHRGKGISKKLIDGSVAMLEQAGCQGIYATADRYNSRSWNMFIHKGFSLFETPQQIKEVGGGFLKLWKAEAHFIGFGTFFLKKNVGDMKPKQIPSIFQFLVVWGWVTLMWWLMSLWGGLKLENLLTYMIVVGMTIGLHEACHIVVARGFGLPAYFKSWESGFLFMLLLALVGGSCPVYGSTYIKQMDWDYNSEQYRRVNGIIYVFGPIVHICLSITCWLLVPIAPDAIWRGTLSLGYNMNIFLVIFNLLPIKGAGGFAWDGAKIFDWNKFIWVGLLGILIAIIVLHSL